MLGGIIGDLRDRVTIQSRNVGADTFGAPVVTWSDAAEVWADVQPLMGRELYEARQVKPDVSHKVTLRYYAGLTPRHRLLFEGRVLLIQSVLNPDKRKRFHEVMAIEEV